MSAVNLKKSYLNLNFILKSGLFLLSALFLGRILGLVREIYLAGHLGTTSQADMAIALITLPDIFINIFIGNAAAAVFLPKIQQLSENQRGGYFIKLSLLFFTVFTCLSFLVYLNLNTLSYLILPSESQSVVFLTNLKWALVAIPFLALNGISRIFLQNEGFIKLIGLENIIFNCCIIIGISFISKNSNSVHFITISILVGSVARWLTQAFKLLKTYINYNTINTLVFEKNDFTKYAQALSTGLVIQFIPLFARSLSSNYQGSGALSVFNYVFKLTEFPLALGFSLLSTLIFPSLSKAFIENKKNHQLIISSTHNYILYWGTPLIILTSFFMLQLSTHILTVYSFENLNIKDILTATAITFLFLILRALNELYMLVMNSMNNVNLAFKSTLLASPIGLVLIYLGASTNGLLGGFIGLNCFYVITFFINLYYLRKNLNLDMPSLFNSKKILILIAVSASIGALMQAINTSLSLTVFLLFWFILYTCLIVYYVFNLRKSYASI